MRNIFRIFNRDIKKIFTNSMAVVLAVGVLLLPSLYAWFNIYANWDPYGKTGNMMVAVCNEDEGAAYKTLQIAIGDQICSNLKANDSINWQFVSKKDAVKGVESGKYYAAIEIPEGFSKNLASIVTDDYERPQIIYYANEKKNAIATKITDKVVQTVQTSVNESFVTTVIDVLSAVLGTAIESDAVTGENAFDYIDVQINDARETLSTLTDALDSMQGLIDATQNMDALVDKKDAKELLNSTEDMVNNTQDAVVTTQATMNTLTSSLGSIMLAASSTLDSSASALENVANKDVSSVIDVLKQTSVQINNVQVEIKEISGLLIKLNSTLPKPIDDITALAKRLDNISNGLADLSSVINKTADIDYNKTALDTAKKLKQASSSLKNCRKTYKNDIQPVLSKAVSSVVVALGNLSDILDGIDDKSSQLDTIGIALADCAESGESLISSMRKVLKSIDSKLLKLKKTVDGIRDSEMLNAAVNLTTKNGGDLGDFLACPVEVKTDKVYGIENYGSAMAPFYSTLAFWVGAMFLAALVKTNIKNKKEISPMLKSYEGFFGRGLLYVGLALIQGVIICLGDLYFLGIQCLHPVQFIFAGALASVVFSMFIYSLVYTFGDVGKAIGVILLVIQIGGSGGTFPIHVTPQFFISINPYLPFTFVIEAMRECICGLYGNNYWIYLLKLLVYAVLALIIGLPVKKMVKKPVSFFEKRVKETGLF